MADPTLITLALESIVILPAALLRNSREQGAAVTLAVFAGMNLLTQPVATFLHITSMIPSVLLVEAMVILAEAAIMAALLEKDRRVALGLSLAANSLSWGLPALIQTAP